MSNIFEKSVPVQKPKRSVFDLSFDYKTSFNMGTLVPVYMEEVIPGDKFKVGTDVMIRFAPLIAPIMDRVDVRLDYFFVPHRLCFDHCMTTNDKRMSFEDFITGGRNGNSVTPFPHFRFTVLDNQNTGALSANHLLDYFGFHVNGTMSGDDTVEFSALPVIAYHLIADNFFRDQTFESSVSDELSDAPLFDPTDGHCTQPTRTTLVSKLLNVRQRLFSKDYFTTAMPTPQRGDSVYLMNPFSLGYRRSSDFPSPASSLSSGDYTLNLYGTTSLNANFNTIGFTDILGNKNYLGSTTTINDFFTLQSIQRWLNNNQNYGGRYVEQLAGHFGVISSDARLQIPQYLGGGKAPIMISEVLQTATNSTSGTSGSTGVGEMSGHALAFGKTSSFSRYFDEHGLIIGILSVIPKISYTTAIPKIFFKKDKFDFAFPEFANIGEQPIKNKEIYLVPENGSSTNEDTFGYTPRYAEYRCHQSLATGYFRDSLSYWHLGRMFSSLPTLSLGFLQVDNDKTKRIFQTTPSSTVMSIYCDCYHNVTAVRPLPLLPNTSLL